jgi:hypothetical protein
MGHLSTYDLLYFWKSSLERRFSIEELSAPCVL